MMRADVTINGIATLGGPIPDTPELLVTIEDPARGTPASRVQFGVAVRPSTVVMLKITESSDHWHYSNRDADPAREPVSPHRIARLKRRLTNWRHQ